jgi:glycerol-3-phosphate dehydrogenase
MSRQDTLDAIRQKPDVSVLIVGAGINGISTFRELALNGVDVLMVDKGDYCSGASAASSHMLHGGIRYLENGEFRLVHEALIERNRLLLNAPHYAKPLPTTIPIFHWFSGTFNAPLKFLGLRDKPSERGALIIKMGLMMYDFFTRSLRVMPTHSFAMRAEALERRPRLNPKVVCAARYYDAWMPYPERISLELIRDTEAASPNAHALNYVRMDGARGNTVMLRDELTGDTLEVRPQVVVNAAGPWIDFANLAMGQKTDFIGGTKGSHLVVDHPELYAACDGDEIFFENKDGRICLIFPFVDGRVIIGTTDIHIDDPEQAYATEEEIQYMLDLVKVVFPDIQVARSNIVATFCGVRPLPSSSTSTTGQISRDHSIHTVEPGNGIDFPVYSLVGGKWTTFRAFGEQAADTVLRRLGRARKVDTKQMPIGGGKGYPKDEAAQRQWVADVRQKTGVPAERVETLFRRYGTHAADIAAYIAAGNDEALVSKPDYSRREIAYIAEHEDVVHLDDLILRRSLLGLLGHMNGQLLDELAAVAGLSMGWSDEQRQREAERAAHILEQHFGYTAQRLATASTSLQ